MKIYSHTLFSIDKSLPHLFKYSGNLYSGIINHFRQYLWAKPYFEPFIKDHYDEHEYHVKNYSRIGFLGQNSYFKAFDEHIKEQTKSLREDYFKAFVTSRPGIHLFIPAGFLKGEESRFDNENQIECFSQIVKDLNLERFIVYKSDILPNLQYPKYNNPKHLLQLYILDIPEKV